MKGRAHCRRRADCGPAPIAVWIFDRGWEPPVGPTSQDQQSTFQHRRAFKEVFCRRTQSPVFEGHYRERPRAHRQVYRQNAERVKSRPRTRIGGEERAILEKMRTEMHTKGQDTCLRHAERPPFECLCDPFVVPGSRWREDPGLVSEVRPDRFRGGVPSACASGRDDERIIEKRFHVQVVYEIVSRQRDRPARQNEIIFAGPSGPSPTVWMAKGRPLRGATRADISLKSFPTIHGRRGRRDRFGAPVVVPRRRIG